MALFSSSASPPIASRFPDGQEKTRFFELSKHLIGHVDGKGVVSRIVVDQVGTETVVASDRGHLRTKHELAENRERRPPRARGGRQLRRANVEEVAPVLVLEADANVELFQVLDDGAPERTFEASLKLGSDVRQAQAREPRLVLVRVEP